MLVLFSAWFTCLLISETIGKKNCCWFEFLRNEKNNWEKGKAQKNVCVLSIFADPFRLPSRWRRESDLLRIHLTVHVYLNSMYSSTLLIMNFTKTAVLLEPYIDLSGKTFEQTSHKNHHFLWNILQTRCAINNFKYLSGPTYSEVLFILGGIIIRNAFLDPSYSIKGPQVSLLIEDLYSYKFLNRGSRFIEMGHHKDEYYCFQWKYKLWISTFQGNCQISFLFFSFLTSNEILSNNYANYNYASHKRMSNCT